MKIINVKIVFLLAMGCLFASEMFAQEAKTVVTGPAHPLVNYGMTRADMNINTIHITDFGYFRPDPDDLFGGEWQMYGSVFQSFTRSGDNLTDTFAISNREDKQVFRYNEKNQLLYWHTLRPAK